MVGLVRPGRRRTARRRGGRIPHPRALTGNRGSALLQDSAHHDHRGQTGEKNKREVVFHTDSNDVLPAREDVRLSRLSGGRGEHRRGLVDERHRPGASLITLGRSTVPAQDTTHGGDHDHNRHPSQQRSQCPGIARCSQRSSRRPGGGPVHLAGQHRVGRRHPQPLAGERVLRSRW